MLLFLDWNLQFVCFDSKYFLNFLISNFSLQLSLVIDYVVDIDLNFIVVLLSLEFSK